MRLVGIQARDNAWSSVDSSRIHLYSLSYTFVLYRRRLSCQFRCKTNFDANFRSIKQLIFLFFYSFTKQHFTPFSDAVALEECRPSGYRHLEVGPCVPTSVE